MAIEAGATYSLNTSLWVRRQARFQWGLSMGLALSDAFVGFSKGLFFTARSITWLALQRDYTEGSWHLRNAAFRVSQAFQILFSQIGSVQALLLGECGAVQRMVHDRFQERETHGTIHIEDVTRDHTYRCIYPPAGQQRETVDTVMTTRTYTGNRGRDRSIPIQFLFDLEHAEGKEQQLLALTKLLVHAPQRFAVEGDLIPLVQYQRDAPISTSHPLYLALQERVQTDEMWTQIKERVCAEVKQTIIRYAKHAISIDIERSVSRARIHRIGEVRYHAEEGRSIGEQVDEIWDRVSSAVERRLPDASELERFKEAIFLMDHLSQTGFSLSELPLNLGVFNIAEAAQFSFDGGEGNGIADFLGVSFLPVRLSKIDEGHEIHLSDDAKTLTAHTRYTLGIKSLDESAEVKGCVLSCSTVVDLTTRAGIVTWDIET